MTNASSVSPSACIAVPTFRRPEYLQLLLERLAVLSTPADLAIEVVIVDNDAIPSAKGLVDALRNGFPFPLGYVHFTEPGLSAVRNFVLDYARNGFDLLFMIDDDEYPEQQWLCELLRVQRQTQADVVVGPVLRKFVDGAPKWFRAASFNEFPTWVPQWLRTGGFYDTSSHLDGSVIASGSTNNCLVCVTSLQKFDVRFEMLLNFHGGEDHLFFQELLRRGAKIVYASGATAWEWVGPERQTIRFLLRLNFRRGNTIGICERRLNGPAALAIRLAKECARLGFGMVMFMPLFLFKGRGGAVWAMCKIAFALGVFTGYRGTIYNTKGRLGAPNAA